MNSRIVQLQCDLANQPVTAERSTIVQDEFRHLPRGLQAKLLTVASESNMVLCRLAVGDWQSLQRVLNGLKLRFPDRGYGALMAELDRNTINSLAQ